MLAALAVSMIQALSPAATSFIDDATERLLAGEELAPDFPVQLQALPPDQRTAVVLRFYEDLPFDEIAAILDCPSSTARSHVHRAVAALRARLTEENPDV